MCVCVDVCVCVCVDGAEVLMRHTVDVFLLLLKRQQSESMRLGGGCRETGTDSEGGSSVGHSAHFFSSALCHILILC